MKFQKTSFSSAHLKAPATASTSYNPENFGKRVSSLEITIQSPIIETTITQPSSIPIMSLLNYISGLLSFFNDQRIIRKIEQLIQSIVEHKTMRLWTISKDKAEFDRYKTLIDGSLKSVLDDQKISQALRDLSQETLSGQKQITLIHDPCDIRKKYASKPENFSISS